MHSNISLEVFGKTNERRSIKSIVLRHEIFIPVFLIFFAGKSISEIHMKARRKSGRGREGVDGIWGRRLIGLRNQDLPT